MTRESNNPTPSPAPQPGGGGGVLKPKRVKTVVVKKSAAAAAPPSAPSSIDPSPAHRDSRPVSVASSAQPSTRAGTAASRKPPKPKVKKEVVVARKIKPGQTIELASAPDGTKVAVSMPVMQDGEVDSDDEEFTGLPRSLAEAGGVVPGPRRTKTGGVVSRDVLGDPSEYEEMKRASQMGTPLSAHRRGEQQYDEDTETSFHVVDGGEPSGYDDNEIFAEDYADDQARDDVRNMPDMDTGSEGGRGGGAKHKPSAFVPSRHTGGGNQRNASIPNLSTDVPRPGTTQQSTRIEELSQAELDKIQERIAESRAQAVESRKSHLRSLSVHDRTDALREERALARWERANAEWDQFSRRLARRLGRDPEEMVFARGQEFREHQEKLDAMYKAMPEDRKNGGDSWLMQLRGGGGAKYVRIGNAVTGLYVPVKESTREMEVIRKPRPNLGKYGKKDRRRDGWKTSDYIQERQQDVVAKKIRDGEEIHDPDYDSLIVMGEKIEPKIVLPAEIIPSDPITFTPYVPPQADTGSGGDGGGDDDIDDGTHHEMAVAGTAGTGTAAGGTRGVVPRFRGPNVRFDTDRVTFWVDCPDKASQIATAHNNGSTTLFYHWRRLSAQEREKKDGDGKTLSVPRESINEKATRFFLANAEGVIVPGESKEFSFVFQSTEPGTFEEVWVLETQPKLSAVSTMTLKGIALDRDDCVVDRQDIDAELHRLEVLHNIEWVVDGIMRDVRTPTPPPRPIIPLTDVGVRFDHQNRQYNLFYHEEEVGQMEALYNRIRPLVIEQETARREAAQAGNKKGGKGGAAGGKSKKGKGANKDDHASDDEAEDKELIPHFPEQWDASVASLRQLCLWLDEGSEERHNALKEAATLLHACSAPWPWDDQDHETEAIARDIIGDMLGRIAGSNIRIREELDLPPREMVYPPRPPPMPIRPDPVVAEVTAKGGKDRKGKPGSKPGTPSAGTGRKTPGTDKDDDDTADSRPGTAAATAATAAVTEGDQGPVYAPGELIAKLAQEREEWSMERQAAEDEAAQNVYDEALQLVGGAVERFAMIRNSDWDTKHYIEENEIFVPGSQLRPIPDAELGSNAAGEAASGAEVGDGDGDGEGQSPAAPATEPWGLTPKVSWDYVAEMNAEFVVEDPKAKKGGKGKKK